LIGLYKTGIFQQFFSKRNYLEFEFVQAGPFAILFLVKRRLYI